MGQEEKEGVAAKPPWDKGKKGKGGKYTEGRR